MSSITTFANNWTSHYSSTAGSALDTSTMSLFPSTVAAVELRTYKMAGSVFDSFSLTKPSGGFPRLPETFANGGSSDECRSALTKQYTC
jgi:hypothetical protein